jgi:hypothetical protein
MQVARQPDADLANHIAPLPSARAHHIALTTSIVVGYAICRAATIDTTTRVMLQLISGPLNRISKSSRTIESRYY